MGLSWPEATPGQDPVALLTELSLHWEVPVLLRVRSDAYVQASGDRDPVFDGVPMSWWRDRATRMRKDYSYHEYVREYYQAFTGSNDLEVCASSQFIC